MSAITGLTQVELVRLLCNLRDRFYPWMRILHRVDGTVVVTISPPPAGGRLGEVLQLTEHDGQPTA